MEQRKTFSEQLERAFHVLKDDFYGSGSHTKVAGLLGNITDLDGNVYTNVMDIPDKSGQKYRKGFRASFNYLYKGKEMVVQITVSPDKVPTSKYGRPSLITEAKFFVNGSQIQEFYRCYLLKVEPMVDGDASYSYYKLKDIYSQVLSVLNFVHEGERIFTATNQSYAQKTYVSKATYENMPDSFCGFVLYLFTSQATKRFNRQFSRAVSSISVDEREHYANLPSGRAVTAMESMATFAVDAWENRVINKRFPINTEGTPRYTGVKLYETLHPRFVIGEQGLLIELYHVVGPGTINDVHFTNISQFTISKEKEFILEKDKISTTSLLRLVKSVLDYCESRVNRV